MRANAFVQGKEQLLLIISTWTYLCLLQFHGTHKPGKAHDGDPCVCLSSPSAEWKPGSEPGRRIRREQTFENTFKQQETGTKSQPE